MDRQLGAFGFLSSDEVMRYGVVNAGLHDQMFALQWVQKYIGLFGGNASQVTISGQSSGGGSVMLHALAFGGHLGDSLFSNVCGTPPDEADKKADRRTGYCCFSIFGGAVWVRRLSTIAVIQCFRFCGRLFGATGVSTQQLERFRFPMPCR